MMSNNKFVCFIGLLQLHLKPAQGVMYVKLCNVTAGHGFSLD